MNVSDYFLTGAGVFRVDCPKNHEPMEKAELLLLHYTAGKDALSAAHYLAAPAVKASAHLVIGRDGRIFQLVPFHIRAWHAGKSSYRGRSDVNAFSLGIEIDNAGKLCRKNGRFFTWFGQEIMPSEVYAHYERGEVSYWHRYTWTQVARLQEVCDLLLQAYPITAIVGHQNVSERKQDPGPALGHWELSGSRLVVIPPDTNGFTNNSCTF